MKIRMTVLVVMTLLFGAIAIGCESSPKTTSYVKLLNFGETMGVSDDIFIGTIISITNEDDIKAKYESYSSLFWDKILPIKVRIEEVWKGDVKTESCIEKNIPIRYIDLLSVNQKYLFMTNNQDGVGVLLDILKIDENNLTSVTGKRERKMIGISGVKNSVPKTLDEAKKYINYTHYYGINVMCNVAEHVFIAKVTDVEAESAGSIPNPNRKQISFNAIVSENLKGDYGVGQKVEDKVNILYKDFVKPGKTYLFLTGIPDTIGHFAYYPKANLYEAVEITESGDLNIYRLEVIKELITKTPSYLAHEPKSLDEIRDLFHPDSVEESSSAFDSIEENSSAFSENTSSMESVSSEQLPEYHDSISSSSAFPKNISSAESVFSEQLTENYNNFKQTVDSIQADKISKIIMVEYVQGKGTAYSLENKQTIKRWISIIKKLEFSSEPFVGTAGLGYEIDVYEGEKKYYIGTWMDKRVYKITNLDTIIYIENYDELRPEIEQLKEDTKTYGKIVDLP